MSFPPTFLALLALGLIVSGVIAMLFGSQQNRGLKFEFTDKDDVLQLKVSGRLQADDPTLLSMRALREALRLRLSIQYLRLLVDVRWLWVGDESGFWLLVGGLGPALVRNDVRVAMLCGNVNVHQRARLAQIDSFERPGQALAFLRLEQAPLERMLDPEWVDSLLLAKRPPSEPRLRRSA